MTAAGSGPEVRLRRAAPADHEAIGALTVAAYAPFLRGDGDGYADRLRDAAARDREAELWVAVADDGATVLGSVALCPEGSPWREVARPGEGEFRMLAVAPSAQRRGVGEALVRLAIDRFREGGASAVVLSSLDGMTAAHGVYARLGFRRLPDRDWEPVPGVRLIGFGMPLRPEAPDATAATGS